MSKWKCSWLSDPDCQKAGIRSRGVMTTYIYLFIIMAMLFGLPGLLAWYCHRLLWKRLTPKYGWTLVSKDFHWRSSFVDDRMAGEYQDRKLSFSYHFSIHHGNVGFWHNRWQTQLQIATAITPDGHFRLDQKKLFRKAGPPIGDRTFDKHTRIIKEKPKGYTAEFLSEPTLRKRVARFFANPVMGDRKISLTPTGLLRLHDSGMIQSEKRLLKNLDLLSDLAKVVENRGN